MTLDSKSDHRGVHKLGFQKIVKFPSELEISSGVMRGFQKGKALGVRTSRSCHIDGLQKGVSKEFAKYLHLIWDLSWGS